MYQSEPPKTRCSTTSAKLTANRKRTGPQTDQRLKTRRNSAKTVSTVTSRPHPAVKHQSRLPRNETTPPAITVVKHTSRGVESERRESSVAARRPGNTSQPVSTNTSQRKLAASVPQEDDTAAENESTLFQLQRDGYIFCVAS